MIPMLVTAAYGVWYGLFAREFKAGAPLDRKNEVSLPTRAMVARFGRCSAALRS
jgi:hypothetical protein